MYETCYDKLQAYFEQYNIQLHYMATDSFVLSVISEIIIKGWQNLEVWITKFDFSNLNENHEIFITEKTKN